MQAMDRGGQYHVQAALLLSAEFYYFSHGAQISQSLTVLSQLVCRLTP